MSATSQAARGEHDPFSGVASARELERLEGGAHDPTRIQLAAFEGDLRGAGGDAVDLRLSDPRAEVIAYVRPGRGTSAGIPERTRVKVDQATFLANRGILCTAEELKRIDYTQSLPGTQALNRDLQAMRKDSIQSSRLNMDPQKLEAEREKAARELGEAEERHAQTMAQAHAELVKPPPPRPVPETREALAARLAEMRAEGEALAARLGQKGAADLQRVLEQEARDLEQAFEQQELQRQVAHARADELQERRAAGAAGPQQKKPARERLAELKAMHADGLIPDDLYQKRQAEILAEV